MITGRKPTDNSSTREKKTVRPGPRSRTIPKVPLASIAPTTSRKAGVQDEPALYVINDTGERKRVGEESRKGT